MKIGNNSMHILQITKYFHPASSFGGPVQCTYNLSKYLVNRGHKVTVYATDALDISSNARIEGEHHLVDGIEVFYFHNIAKSYGFFISPGMIRKLKQEIGKFDIVHLHEYRTFQNLAFHFLNRKRIPYVLSCHGEFSYGKETWSQIFLRKLFDKLIGGPMVSNASRLIALTEFEKSQYLNGGVEKNRITIIPNGVGSDDFLDLPVAGLFRKLYNISDETIILYIGRINKYKGIDFLVKAFALICKDRSDIKLVLAGPDDGFVRTLKKMIDGLGLNTNVLFTGSLDRRQVAAAYSDCSVVVYASVQEGFPIVPLEAGNAGKPVIVTNIPAMGYVTKGQFGLTVQYGNVNQLKDAIETLLNNSELSNELGENGKRFVRQNYSWQAIGKKIEDLYYKTQ